MLKKTTLFSILLLTFLSTLSAQAESKTLWDLWYTLKLNQKVPYAYYNEKLEIKDGKIALSFQLWKKEEGYINQESLGAFAKDDSQLTPLFFNFRSTYRTVETIIDGNIDDNRLMKVKIKRGASELPVVTSRIQKDVFLSSFFPLWMARNALQLKPGQSKSFSTIKEDDLDNAFKSSFGSVLAEKPDEIAKNTKTQKFKIDFLGQKSIWWIRSDGSIERAEVPVNGLITERVSETVAKKFLD